MILLTLEPNGHSANPDDRCHDPDAQLLFLEVRPLFDVGLQVADVAIGFDPGRVDSGESDSLERSRHRLPGGIGRSQVGFAENAAPGLASETAGVGALLVGPGDSVHCEIGGLRVVAERSGHLDPVDHAQGAVEPATAGLGIGVGADDKGRSGLFRSPDHVSGPVDRGVEAGLVHSRPQPSARLHVDVGEGGSNHTGSGGSEAPQGGEVVE